jgi:hypothetical protein
MNYRKRFVVEPGAKVRLGKIDPAFKGNHESKEKAVPEIQKHVERMAKAQYMLYAESRWNVWRYRVVNGLEVKAKEEPENEHPFQRHAEAAAFLKRIAPDQGGRMRLT